MHPILFEFGPIVVRFYGLMYVVAIISAWIIIKHEVKRKNIPLTEEELPNLITWCVIGGLLVARLYYVVFNLDVYLAHPAEIPAIWHGGLAIHGGLIGGVLGAWLYLRRKAVPFWRMSDAVAPSLIIGQAFGRFGNFMNGDAHGRVTDMPWGVVFPLNTPAGSQFPGMPTHPAMLYELLFNVTIFCFLWFVVRKREHKDGFIFALYFMLYSFGRFVVEHFRADSLMFGPLKAAQLVSLVLIAVMLVIVLRKRMWSKES